MFEDLKHELFGYKKESEKPLSATLSSEVLEKYRQQGIDPDNVTLQQLFPPTFDLEGNDLSLMSGAEWEIMVTHARTH